MPLSQNLHPMNVPKGHKVEIAGGAKAIIDLFRKDGDQLEICDDFDVKRHDKVPFRTYVVRLMLHADGMASCPGALKFDADTESGLGRLSLLSPDSPERSQANAPRDRIQIDPMPVLHMVRNHYRNWQIRVQNLGNSSVRIGAKLSESNPPLTDLQPPLALELANHPGEETVFVPAKDHQFVNVCRDSNDTLISLLEAHPKTQWDVTTVKQEYLWTIVAFTEGDGRDERQFRLTLGKDGIKLEDAQPTSS